MPVKEYAFSEFLRNSKAAAGEVEHADLLLVRRDGPDLHVALADRWVAQMTGIGMVARLLRKLDPKALDEVAGALLDELPWVRFLPNDDRRTFAHEFLDCVEASASVENFAPLGELLEDWQNTAGIWADPELAAELTRPLSGNGGTVPRP